MKRGISPLIATVLLVGLAATLAIILMNFFNVFSQDQINDIEEDQLKNDYCSKAPLNLNHMCYNSLTSILTIGITNGGSAMVTGVDLNFIVSGAVGATHSISGDVAPFGFYSEDITYTAGIIEKIIYVKEVSLNGQVVTCDPITIVVNVDECE